MWSSAARGLRRRSGLTLLEVLAAVALLGIVFTALARSAALGVISEGGSRRILEASLVADSRLTELELAASNGVVPEIGTLSEELDDFTIEIETQPWALPARLQSEREAAIDAPSEIFGDGTLADPGVVREIRLRVTWSDGVNERWVERTTYATDLLAIADDPNSPLASALGGLTDAQLEALDTLGDAEETQ